MKTIMLVDDSTSIRNILKGALISEYRVLEAENGKQGLETALTSQVDLFLLDVNMPVMDGIRLLEQLKKLPQFSNTPAIMLTTETKAERKQEARTLGAAGWILKPCEPDKLLAAVKNILK